jgi:peptide chain release factor 2
LVSQKINTLKEEVEKWEKIEKEARELLSLSNLAQKEGDTSLGDELNKKFSELQKKFEKLEFYLLMSGKFDRESAIIAIHAGTGGREAQDWAEMLLRMYLRFCEKKSWRSAILDESRGGDGGLKSVTFSVQGTWAYGYLKSEAGVHRLVRISPFDAEKMRHTSFALVEVLPELPDSLEIDIDPKDLRIDTFCASGHGGQSVNTTYSAVRIVHLPTNITVSCQNERSQHQNKEVALKILKTKLHQLEEQKKEKEKQALRGEYAAAEWGNQIRSYVLHPYKMVKDHRTKYEASDTEAVLDGDLEGFMEAYLRYITGQRDLRAEANRE